MYIINQANNEIAELKSVKIYSCYSAEVQKELSEIFDRMIIKAYSYGTTENCKRAIKKEQEEYVTKKPKEYKISVNGNDFATYTTETKARHEFNEIKDSIREGKTIHILS